MNTTFEDAMYGPDSICDIQRMATGINLFLNDSGRKSEFTFRNAAQVDEFIAALQEMKGQVW